MQYEKQNFYSGQTLLASHLNHIEDGIDNVSTEVNRNTQAVSQLKEDISQLSKEIENISTSGISAAGAASGQVPVADGNGGWAWGTAGGESLTSAEEVSF